MGNHVFKDTYLIISIVHPILSKYLLYAIQVTQSNSEQSKNKFIIFLKPHKICFQSESKQKS